MKISEKEKNSMKVTRKKPYLYFTFPSVTFPSLGWKIHISATFKNFRSVLNIVKNFCIQSRKNFKVLEKDKDFFFSLSRPCPRENSCKYITIYPSDIEDAKFIMSSLYSLLKHFKGPVILTDRPYKNSIIQYRYGFSDPKLRDTETLVIGQYKPKDIPDPFQEEENLKTEYEIREYKILQALSFSNFGGTYLVQDSHGNNWVAKEARPFIGSFEDQPLLNRKREMKLFKRFSCEWFPRFKEFFEFNKHFYSIVEYFPGFTLEDFRREYSLIFHYNLSTPRKTKIEAALKKLIILLVDFFAFTQSSSLILNDVKEDNFLWDGQSNLKFIDLDSSFFVNDKPVYILDKYHRVKRNFSFVKDVRDCGYMLMNIISFSGSLQNKYTYHKRITQYFEYFCNINNVCQELKSKILYFANFNHKHSLEKVKLIGKAFNKKISSSFPKFSIKPELLRRIDVLSFINNRLALFFESKNDLWKQAFEALVSNNLKESQKIIDEIKQKHVLSLHGAKYVQIDTAKLSYYLEYGAPLLLFYILQFRFNFQKNLYDELIVELTTPLAKGTFSSVAFFNGALGVIMVFIFAYQVLRSKKYLKYAGKHLHKLKWNYISKISNYVDINGQPIQKWEKELILLLNEFLSAEDVIPL